MKRRIRHLLFFLLCGLLLAHHVSHVRAPHRSPLVPFHMSDGWLGDSAPLPRAYFRHSFELAFAPRHAWVALCANDYFLYVNGRQVAGNQHVSNSGHALQSRLSDAAQSLTLPDLPRVVREPNSRTRANEDWRLVQLYDLMPFLRAGRNTIAVAVQSDQRGRLAITGEISAGPLKLELPGFASAWLSSPTSTGSPDTLWYEPGFDDTTWTPAVSLGPVEKETYAIADPAIWCEPFVAQPVTAAQAEKELVLRLPVPAGARGTSGWLRVSSNCPHRVFVDDVCVASVSEGGRITAVDLAAHLARGPEAIGVRVVRGEVPGPGDRVPWAAVDGRLGEAGQVETGAHWLASAFPEPEWMSGAGEWSAAVPHQRTVEPIGLRLMVPVERDLAWLLDLLKWTLPFALLLGVGSRLLADLLRAAGGLTPESAARRAFALLTPPVLGVAMVELLRLRLAESDAILAFLDPRLAPAWLFVGPVLLLVGVMWMLKPRPARSLRPAASERKPSHWPTLVCLGLILVLGLALRMHGMGLESLQADENVSWDAARGILREGVPRAVSGVLYTRSPLYHYLLAGWLAVFGDNLLAARSFSLLPNLAVVPLAFLLVRTLGGRRLIALLVAAWLALDPWLVNYAGLVRFYSLLQFFVVLCVLLFLKGFVLRHGKRYQHLFFFAICAAVLSQEVFVTFLPAFCLVILVGYRPFRWREDWTIVLGFATVTFIALVDIWVFSTACLTPHAGIATSSGSIMQIHFGELLFFASSFFAGERLAQIPLTLFFLLGLLHWLRVGDRGMLAIYAIVLLTLLTLTILVMLVAGRYGYGLYPVFVVAAALSADALVRRWAEALFPEDPHGLARWRWSALVGLILVAAMTASMELPKLWDSYARQRTLQHDVALAHVRDTRRPGDRIMSVYPMPAAILLGGIDYYMMGVIAFDELYQREHGIVDRWAGGVMVTHLDQFRRVFLANERVWLMIDEHEATKFSPVVLDFIDRVCEVRCEFLGGRLMLWDRSAGRFASFPEEGAGVNAY